MKKILTAILIMAFTLSSGAAVVINSNVNAKRLALNCPACSDTCEESNARLSVKGGKVCLSTNIKQDEGLNTTSKSAYLIDYDSGTVLYSQNHQERYPIASMCKIMTLLIIYEKMEDNLFNENDIITISETASSMGGSQVFLSTNDSYKISDLIKSITVSSANDASVAMAEHISGSEEGFVVLMNTRAKELGMKNTHFTNSTGLPKPGQYSTAEDVAIMTRELLKHKSYFNYSRIWMDKLLHKGGRETELTNTNKLVRFYKGCDGGKTGYTSEAKHCISSTAVRDGMRLISVIIGAENSKVRFAEASKLLNHGFANFTSKRIVSCDKPLELKLSVKGGKSKTVELLAEENFSILISKNKKADFKLDYSLPETIKAPVQKGDVVGKISVIFDNTIIKEINIITASDIGKNSLGDVIGDILHNW